MSFTSVTRSNTDLQVDNWRRDSFLNFNDGSFHDATSTHRHGGGVIGVKITSHAVEETAYASNTHLCDWILVTGGDELAGACSFVVLHIDARRAIAPLAFPGIVIWLHATETIEVQSVRVGGGTEGGAKDVRPAFKDLSCTSHLTFLMSHIITDISSRFSWLL